MSIILKKPEDMVSYTAEEWENKCWKEKAEKHSKELKNLDVTLHKLFDDFIPEYKAYLTDIYLSPIKHFIEKRKPNETPIAFYTRTQKNMDLGIPENGNEWRNEWKRSQRMFSSVMGASSGICKFTNHPKEQCEWRDWKNGSYKKTNLNKIRIDRKKIEKTVDQRIERSIKESVEKIRYKVLSLLIADDYTCDLLDSDGRDTGNNYGCRTQNSANTQKSCDFSDGVFSGWMKIEFSNGGSFKFHLQVTESHDYFASRGGDYRFNFHDVESPEGGFEGKLVSEADVLRIFKVKSWQPPQQVKRKWFDKLKTGDVVLLKDGDLSMVTYQRKDKFKVWHPDRDEKEVSADDLKEILAHTDPRSSGVVYTGILDKCKIEVVEDRSLPYAQRYAQQRKDSFVVYLEDFALQT
ncbi:MAG: hypothetical protein ACW99G_12060 [Candidatus Thorarchaeota archaeon]|jgi:hypothetical protein